MSNPISISRDMLRRRLVDQLTASAPDAGPAQDYSHIDLLSLSTDEIFISEAYRRILFRRPDVDGIQHFKAALRSISRQEVIEALREAAAREQQASRNNALPAGAAATAAPRRLPATLDLRALDEIASPEIFVRECYTRILGREPDPEGFHQYWSLLRVGVSREQVMAILAASAEARAREVTFRRDGSALPEPRLGVIERLRLLLSKLTGASNREARLAFLQMRHDQADETLRQLSARIGETQGAIHEVLQLGQQRQSGADAGTAQLREAIREVASQVAQARQLEASVRNIATEVARTHGSITADTQRLHEVLHELINEAARANASMITAAEGLQQGIQNLTREAAHAHGANVEVWSSATEEFVAAHASLMEAMRRQSDMPPGAISSLLEKLDAIAEDVRIRQEGLAAQQDTLAIQHRDAANTLSAMLRPPVLAGKDEYLVRVGDLMLAIPIEDLALAGRYAFWGAVDQGLSRCLAGILRPGMIFVDIGANVGLHTLEAARAVGPAGKVYSFEPTPRTVAALRKNLELNEVTGVEVFASAVLDRSGETVLYVNASTSSLNTVVPGEAPMESVCVPAVTLDEALWGRERVDVIKIDVEGAEPLVLRGMTNILRENPRLTLILEFAASHLHRAGLSPEEEIQKLRDHGFRIRRIEDFSGNLVETPDQEILTLNSSNLHLERVNHHGAGIS